MKCNKGTLYKWALSLKYVTKKRQLGHVTTSLPNKRDVMSIYWITPPLMKHSVHIFCLSLMWWMINLTTPPRDTNANVARPLQYRMSNEDTTNTWATRRWYNQCYQNLTSYQTGIPKEPETSQNQTTKNKRKI
jgi:hypothetical protein